MTVPHVGQEMLTLSGTYNFTPFGKFMITHSLYMHYILLNLSVLGLYLRINDCGLFAWIDCFVSDLFYYVHTIILCADCASSLTSLSILPRLRNPVDQMLSNNFSVPYSS